MISQENLLSLGRESDVYIKNRRIMSKRIEYPVGIRSAHCLSCGSQFLNRDAHPHRLVCQHPHQSIGKCLKKTTQNGTIPFCVVFFNKYIALFRMRIIVTVRYCRARGRDGRRHVLSREWALRSGLLSLPFPQVLGQREVPLS